MNNRFSFSLGQERREAEIRAINLPIDQEEPFQGGLRKKRLGQEVVTRPPALPP